MGGWTKERTIDEWGTGVVAVLVGRLGGDDLRRENGDSAVRDSGCTELFHGGDDHGPVGGGAGDGDARADRGAADWLRPGKGVAQQSGSWVQTAPG
jgi:hypothetical protein